MPRHVDSPGRRLLLAAACLLTLFPWSGLPAAEAPSSGSQADAAGPDEALQPFLGTWKMEEDFTRDNDDKSYRVHRYILIRWRKDRLQVKTFDYLPAYRARDMESNWKGEIPIDQWNHAKQTFTPMPDGTISVGLSGTDGIGRQAARNIWWAAGTFSLLPPEDGTPRLRFHTFKGYAPAPTGNAWKPFDRVYRLVSRDIDPALARPIGR